MFYIFSSQVSADLVPEQKEQEKPSKEPLDNTSEGSLTMNQQEPEAPFEESPNNSSQN